MTTPAASVARRRPWLDACRVLLALWVLGVIADNGFISRSHGETLLNFWSYFTNQSNCIAAFVLLGVGIGIVRSRPVAEVWLRGAGLLYLTTTLIVNQAVLNGGLSDPVLHLVAPILVIVDWVIDAPRYRIGLGMTGSWLIYPVVWMVYTFIHGAASGWYPYHFINVAAIGAGAVTIWMVVLAALLFLFAQAIRLSARLLAPSPNPG